LTRKSWTRRSNLLLSMNPISSNNFAAALANIKIPVGGMSNISIPRMPSFREILKENQKGESAGALINRLAARIRHWRKNLPQNQQPVIWAVMASGTCVNVHSLSEESHNGIFVEGDVQGQPCMLLCHQANIQMLCFVEEIKKEEERREIGFHVNQQRQGN
jgi:hypothetical protein